MLLMFPLCLSFYLLSDRRDGQRPGSWCSPHSHGGSDGSCTGQVHDGQNPHEKVRRSLFFAFWESQLVLATVEKP